MAEVRKEVSTVKQSSEITFTDLFRIKLAEQRHGGVFLGPTSA